MTFEEYLKTFSHQQYADFNRMLSLAFHSGREAGIAEGRSAVPSWRADTFVVCPHCGRRVFPADHEALVHKDTLSPTRGYHNE